MPRETIGVVGLGIMGSAMSSNLTKAGFRVLGFDPLPARQRHHQKMGGIAVSGTGELAKSCMIVITSLPSVQALAVTVEALSKARRPNQVVIETSTLPIPAKKKARKSLAAQGILLLDCPLSGTGAQAKSKDLIVYASGDPKACKRIRHVFAGFARAHYYIGEFGSGSQTKFIANLLVAIHNVAAAEALVLGMKSGLDPALLLKVIKDGAGNSRILELRGPMMVRGDYSKPTMKMDVWQKDMTIIGDFARTLDCPTPLFSASAPFYTAAMAMGLGASDTGSVCRVLERLANQTAVRSHRSGKGRRSVPRVPR